MKIAKALKKVTKLKGEISELNSRLQSSSTTLKDNEFEEKYNDLIDEMDAKKEELVDLKNKIMVANVNGGKYKQILTLGELKDYLSTVKNISVTNGVQARSYGEGTLEYKSQLTLADKRTQVKSLEERIEAIVDELDEFNATTEI